MQGVESARRAEAMTGPGLLLTDAARATLAWIARVKALPIDAFVFAKV
jgi:antitoxin component of RelBE/YafQ-DinJ toxin-antitoxin module